MWFCAIKNKTSDQFYSSNLLVYKFEMYMTMRFGEHTYFEFLFSSFVVQIYIGFIVHTWLISTLVKGLKTQVCQVDCLGLGWAGQGHFGDDT